MLTIDCLGSDNAAQQQLGPFEHLRLEGGALISSDGREVARLEAGGWSAEGETWATLKITALAELQFESGERRSAGYGPFNEVILAGPIVEAAGRTIADIAEDGLHDAHHARWSALTITPSFSAHG